MGAPACARPALEIFDTGRDIYVWAPWKTKGYLAPRRLSSPQPDITFGEALNESRWCRAVLLSQGEVYRTNMERGNVQLSRSRVFGRYVLDYSQGSASGDGWKEGLLVESPETDDGDRVVLGPGKTNYANARMMPLPLTGGLVSGLPEELDEFLKAITGLEDRRLIPKTACLSASNPSGLVVPALEFCPAGAGEDAIALDCIEVTMGPYDCDSYTCCIFGMDGSRRPKPGLPAGAAKIWRAVADFLF